MQQIYFQFNFDILGASDIKQESCLDMPCI